MPALEISGLRQRAVLFPLLRFDKFSEPVVGDPVEIAVRWEWGQRQALDSTGAVIALDATVTVDRPIKIGSRLWQGKLADWYGTGSNDPESNIVEVKTYSEIPDDKGRSFMREVGCMRWHDKDTGE